MRKLFVLALAIALLALLAACDEKTADVQGTGTAPASTSPRISPEAKETASPTAKPIPRVFSAEELLSAAEATGFVGQPVTASFEPVEVSDTGETSGTYIYDLPNEGIDVKDSVAAAMCVVQNGLISPSELEKGYDANWAFEDFRKTLPDKVVDLSGLGGKAFYVKDNSDVHVLFQDYYILVALLKDDTDPEANLEINKAIAAFIVGKISLADVSLT